jgi:hypothetical protein
LLSVNFAANQTVNLEIVAIETQKKEFFYTSELHVSLSVAQNLLTGGADKSLALTRKETVHQALATQKKLACLGF